MPTAIRREASTGTKGAVVEVPQVGAMFTTDAEGRARIAFGCTQPESLLLVIAAEGWATKEVELRAAAASAGERCNR
jgi:hypothetical protein